MKTQNLKWSAAKLITFMLMCLIITLPERVQGQLKWKNFTGSIPSNAVIGGYENGTDLPVCRCEHDGVVYPGKVVSNMCHIGYSGYEAFYKTFEVLINEGTAIRWERITEGEMLPNAVAAGMENGQYVYVGKAERATDRSVHPGRVFRAHNSWMCHYSWGGKEVKAQKKFYVLVQENASLSILNYNVMLLSKTPFPNHRQDYRAVNIAKAIKKAGNWDVVVFNEAFENDSRKLLQSQMVIAGYPHSTKVVDKEGNMTNGGVFIMSRHPIQESDMIIYNDCHGTFSDCMANKGAMYIKIDKNGRSVHIFGTHLQAERGATERSVRTKQLQQLHQFAFQKTSEAANRGEPVIFAGDLNFCYTSDKSEYFNALKTLNAKMTSERPKNDQWTFNPKRNSIAKYRYKNERKQWLDYILVSKQGLQPVTTTLKVYKFKSDQRYNMPAHGDPLGVFDKGTNHYDLSDHYGLSAVFQFSPITIN